MNNKKKLSLSHPLSTFGSFSFIQASLWLTNLIKVSSNNYFNVTSWFPGNVCVKPHFNTVVGVGGKMVSCCFCPSFYSGKIVGRGGGMAPLPSILRRPLMVSFDFVMIRLVNPQSLWATREDNQVLENEHQQK